MIRSLVLATVHRRSARLTCIRCGEVVEMDEPGRDLDRMAHRLQGECPGCRYGYRIEFERP